MDHYIGLDAHMKSCTFVVLTAKGKHVLTQRVETNGRALCSFIRSVAGIKHLCLEECELSEWLYELFYPLVTELKVVQPKKREGPKSDASDARDLAELLRTGSKKPGIFKAPGAYRSLREAVRAQQLFSREVARTKNQIKAIYRSRGIRVSGRQVFHPAGRLEFVAQLPPAHRQMAQLLYESLDSRSCLSQQCMQ